MKKQTGLIFVAFLMLVMLTTGCVQYEIDYDRAVKEYSSKSFDLYSLKSGGVVVLRSFEGEESLKNFYNRLLKDDFNNLILGNNLSLKDKKLLKGQKAFVTSYSLKETRPIIVGKDMVMGMVFGVDIKLDHKHREVAVFNVQDKYFAAYFIGNRINSEFYSLLKNLDLKGYKADNKKGVYTDAVMVGDLDLGEDNEGKEIVIKAKTYNSYSTAARNISTNVSKIGIIVTVSNFGPPMEKVTVDVVSALGEKQYKNDSNIYTQIESGQVCEYSVILPINSRSKTEIREIMNNMEVFLRYETNNTEHTKQII